MSHPPLNLTARDFDAYTAEKATSHAYARPRLEVKQRAMAWARAVVTRLAELRISVDVHGSDEHPSLRNKQRVDCQWVFFWRDQAARDELDRLLDRGRSMAAVIDDPSPYTRHAFLALRIDAATVEVCFAVHPDAKVDVDNLRARLSEGEAALTAELITALKALPEEFAIGVSPDDRIAAGTATPELIRTMIERAALGQTPLWIGWSVKRETALEHAAILDEQLEDAIIALAPIYRLVAWSRDNDPIALDRRIQSIEQERALAHAAAEAETNKWRTEQAEARRRSIEEARARGDDHRRTDPIVRRPSLEALFAAFPARPPSTPPRAPAPSKQAPTRSHSHEAHKPNPEPKPARPLEPPRAALSTDPSQDATAGSGKPRTPPEPTLPPGMEKGNRVCVKAGPFAGKVGVLGELDGKGGARVMLGLLSTKLDLADLEPVVEARDRPALHSSHRKPLTPPTRKPR